VVLTLRSVTVVLAGSALMATACTGGDPVMDPSPSSATDAAADSFGDVPGSPSESPDGGIGASEQPSAAGPDPTTDEGRTDDGRTYLVADLDAGSVPDGAGDGRATGTFEGALVPLESTVELCYELEVEDLTSAPVGAHIVRDEPPGSDDVAVVDLVPPDAVTGRVEECITIDGGDAVALFESPQQHYVVVSTEDHPFGAVQGSLRKG